MHTWSSTSTGTNYDFISLIVSVWLLCAVAVSWMPASDERQYCSKWIEARTIMSRREIWFPIYLSNTWSIFDCLVVLLFFVSDCLSFSIIWTFCVPIECFVITYMFCGFHLNFCHFFWCKCDTIQNVILEYAFDS